MTLKFTKMHGCGNDYIFINGFRNDCILVNGLGKEVLNPEKLSQVLSDRRCGVGGDGIILILPSEIANAKMRIFNKDGSEGKMCGNGIRCVGKFLCDNNTVSQDNDIKIETLSGVKNLKILENSENEALVSVNMGKASLNPKDIPMLIEKDKVINDLVTISDQAYHITCVSIGNPHCVMFFDEIYSVNIKDIGPRLSTYTMFPEGANVEFVSVQNKNNLAMRVWERGSGETLACGTGACASVVAAVENGFCEKGSDITVHLRGGKLVVNYTDEAVYMTGNAVKVFEGEVRI